MKILFIFVLFAYALAADENDLKIFNKYRRRIAKKYGIPNMWALQESAALDLYGQYFHKNCTKYANIPFRYFWTGGMADEHNFNVYWRFWFKKVKDQNQVEGVYKIWANETAFFLEYSAPLQKKLWCMPETCAVTSVPPRNMLPEKITYYKLCIIGPETELATSVLTGQKPGSECKPNGRNDDGLCVPI
ncbi:unnamed protein product [Caenorhabditis brenneri]